MYGTSLKEARQRAGLSLEQLSEMLDIRVAYLESAEQGDLDGLLGPTYAANVLTRYARAVDLDPLKVVGGYLDETHVPAEAPAPEEPSSSASPGRASLVGRRARAWARRPLVMAAVAAVVVLCVVGVVGLTYFWGDIGGASATGSTSGTTEGAAGQSTTTSGPAVPVVASSSTTEVQAPTTTTKKGSTTTTKKASNTTVKGSTATTSKGSTTTVRKTGVTTTASAAGAFTLVLAPAVDVWFKITEVKGGTVIFSGVKKAGEKLKLDLNGPAEVVVGRPNDVSVSIDGRKVSAPPTQFWRIEKTGVKAGSGG